MTVDFLAQLFENTIRARLLRLFFGADEQPFSLETIKRRIHVGTRKKILKELGRLVRMKVIRVCTGRETGPAHIRRGRAMRTKREPQWAAPQWGPHMRALRAFIRETGIAAADEPKLLEKLRRVGRLRFLVVSVAFLNGREGEAKVDMLLVGDGFNVRKMDAVLRAIEAEYGREIRYASFSPKEYAYRLDVQDRLIRDLLDYPHQVLIDKL